MEFPLHNVYHFRTRFGLLLEDLDSLAGNVAFAHCDDGDPNTPAPLLVTASVDRLLLRERLTMAAVMKLRGRTMCATLPAISPHKLSFCVSDTRATLLS